MNTEVLIGGVCDGLVIPKVDGDRTFAGRIGNGFVNVYLRKEDGKLHYSHQYNVHDKTECDKFFKNERKP